MADSLDKNKLIESLKDVIGIDAKLARKKKTKQLIDKDRFVEILSKIGEDQVRLMVLQNDYDLDYYGFAETYYEIISDLFSLHFTEKQVDVINWYLYEKFSPTGDVSEINNVETGDIIPTDSPEDIWNLIHAIKE